MTPRQVLLAHLRGQHRLEQRRDSWEARQRGAYRLPPRSATQAQLGAWHARQHQRYGSSQDHYHEEDGAGPPTGPGSTVRRPSGWWTGLGVAPRTARRSS